MQRWKNVTDTFLEEQRYYKNKYLEIDEVFEDKIEVSIFSSIEEKWEVYFSYGYIYGIIYVTEESAYQIFEDVKNDLASDYLDNGNVSEGFAEYFFDKYDACIPSDTLYDEDQLREMLTFDW